MPRATLSAVLTIAAVMAGCDAPRPDLPPSAPHGGTAFALGDDKGFVEVLRRDSPTQPEMTTLVVYFLDAERKSLGAAPTAATFQPRRRGGEPVALKPSGDAGPRKSGEWASPPFRDPGDIVGLLSVTVDGKPVSIAINAR